jgi:DNA modification methylase
VCETVLTPFLGIGSEVFAAVEMGRKGVGIELKPNYFRQAVRNIAKAGKGVVEQSILEPVD